VIELLTTDWSDGWNPLIIDDRAGGVDGQARRAEGDEVRTGIADRQ